MDKMRGLLMLRIPVWAWILGGLISKALVALVGLAFCLVVG